MLPTHNPPCPSQSAILHNNRNHPRQPRHFIVEAEVLTPEFLAATEVGARQGCSLCRILRPRYLAEKLQVKNARLLGTEGRDGRDGEGEKEGGGGKVGLVLARPTYWKGTALPALDDEHGELVKLLKGWIEGCDKGHEACGRGRANCNPFTPRRLIEIRQARTPSGSIRESLRLRLVEGLEPGCGGELTDSTPPNAIRYATLSYMWGPTPHSATTTQSNYQERCSDIAFKSLPKTLQDAVFVTHSIGFSYLWIDALCIIQPTKENSLDWELQSATMADIYGNSSLTIAASSSTSVQKGFLYERPDRVFSLDPVAYKPELGDFVMDHSDEVYSTNHDELEFGTDWLNPRVPSFQACVLDGPLNTRGWVLQERFFSPRVAHFTQKGLFWECVDLMASDYEPRGLRDREDVEANQRELSIRKGVDLSDGLFWLDLVRRYSDLDLTDRQDVLPAVSGIVHWMLARTDDRYHAGIMSSMLLESLCWSAEEKQLSRSGLHKRLRGIPTWSWASVDCPVSFSPYLLSTWNATKPVWRINVLGVDVTPCGADPYGRVSSGRLTVEGIIIPVLGSPDQEWRRCENSAPNHFVSNIGNDYLSIDDLAGHDYIFERLSKRETVSFLIVMTTVQNVRGSRPKPVQMLACEGILLRAKGPVSEYERIGWFRVYLNDTKLDGKESCKIVLI